MKAGDQLATGPESKEIFRKKERKKKTERRWDDNKEKKSAPTNKEIERGLRLLYKYILKGLK
uniref:Uncharacterized protein n=1 Tax=Rhizophora mucronata TaxID=61149 RepID=A0A2P2NIA6_RHIMU